MKTVEDQVKKQIKTLEDHGKQLVKYSDEKESFNTLKKEEIFEELANGIME